MPRLSSFWFRVWNENKQSNNHNQHQSAKSSMVEPANQHSSNLPPPPTQGTINQQLFLPTQLRIIPLLPESTTVDRRLISQPVKQHSAMPSFPSSLIFFLIPLLLLSPAQCRVEDRYDLNNLPFDLKPVQGFIGLWQKDRHTGHFRDLPPPDLVDFAINPIPKFGARTVNITHTYWDADKSVIRSDYGFMPVKNATRRDPRVHVAYLTTSSEGWSMMEQGFYKDGKLIFHLKQFLKRSFGVGSRGSDLDIREFERQFELMDFHSMTLKIRAETSIQTESYTAFYRKILY